MKKSEKSLFFFFPTPTGPLERAYRGRAVFADTQFQEFETTYSHDVQDHHVIGAAMKIIKSRRIISCPVKGAHLKVFLDMIKEIRFIVHRKNTYIPQ
jgi:hypothetical protein